MRVWIGAVRIDWIASQLRSTIEASPYRCHVRDPSFYNLQSLPIMARGGLVADLIACIASLDPIMGGVDR